MLFEKGTFAPWNVGDERTAAVLEAASERASGRVRPSDLLVAVIKSQNTIVLAKLEQALTAGSSLPDLLELINIYNPARVRPTKFDGSAAWFSPETLAVLNQFEAELTDLRKQAEDPQDAILALLYACVLEHLDVEDEENLTPILDAKLGATQIREWIKSIILPPPPLFDSESERLRSDEFSESGWTIMEHTAIRAADLGYDRLLPPHCFLALLGETEGAAEHLVRLQAQPEIGPGKVAQMVTEAFRLADRRMDPLELTRDSLGESMVDMLRTAQKKARLWGSEKIDSLHLLSVLIEEMPPRLASVLQRSPLNLDLKKMRVHLDQYLRESRTQTTREVPLRLPVGLLPSEDLTYRARTDGLPKAVLPQKEKEDEEVPDLYDAMTRALYRRVNNHVLITGLRGIGKTTLVWELARRAAAGEIPFLRRKRFLWVDCQDVPLHESKDKLTGILAHVSGRTDLILCLDGLGPLLRAESGANNKLILRGALKERRVHLIGIMSNNDFEDLLSSDHEMLEFFTRVKAEEPEEATAHAIVKQVSARLQEDYKVTIEESAIERAVFLSAHYILNERLPTKAIKILRQVCEDLDYERTQHEGKRTTVTSDGVIKIVAEISSVPEETLRGVAKKIDYKEALETTVVGQKDAVEAVATMLRLIKAGMTDPGKPAAVILFAGLTGVGKTELAKALAQLYSSSKRLQTYTMGNFIESHSVSGIIGVPPGYVGHDQGGRLINDLNSDPYCVFLLDEAEKAHPDVWKPFLNLLDEAWIVDTRGVKAFADRAIFILTSNAGASVISQLSQIGEKDIDKIGRKVKDELLKITHPYTMQPVFTPEFLARITRIIVFKPLDQEAMKGISEKLKKRMEKTWKEKRQKTLVIPDGLIDYIAEQSHRENERSGGTEGGRIVSKLMSQWIEAKIEHEVSEHEDDYRAATVIELKFWPPLEALPLQSDKRPEPKITVLFHKQQLQSSAE